MYPCTICALRECARRDVWKGGRVYTLSLSDQDIFLLRAVLATLWCTRKFHEKQTPEVVRISS